MKKKDQNNPVGPFAWAKDAVLGWLWWLYTEPPYYYPVLLLALIVVLIGGLFS